MGWPEAVVWVSVVWAMAWVLVAALREGRRVVGGR